MYIQPSVCMVKTEEKFDEKEKEGGKKRLNGWYRAGNSSE